MQDSIKIIDALRVAKGEVVAIVGAGGKTSLMFALANALPKPVCLTTTTKLGYQEGIGFFPHQLYSEAMRIESETFEPVGALMITNPTDESGQKWLGLLPEQASRLIQICREKGVICLIEVDGARRCSLKAPAAWEPVIPARTDWVAVVVGLSVIGKTLREGVVFRPELFSALTGCSLGAPIQIKHILRMLNHPEGGLKGVPPGSRVVAVFNQADAYALSAGERAVIQETLSSRYSAALLTALRSNPTRCEALSSIL